MEGRGYTLEVGASNAATITLFERFGFRVRGTRRGYYNVNREDALIMRKEPVDESLRGRE
jgi:ribosomal-protein-alanine N-acetyltransferase